MISRTDYRGKERNTMASPIDAPGCGERDS